MFALAEYFIETGTLEKVYGKEKRMEALCVTDLKKTYGEGDTAVEALKGINLIVEKG